MSTHPSRLKALALCISAALTVTACSDSDGPAPQPPAVETEARTLTVNFSSQVSGVAVKGAMQASDVSVTQLNDDGTESPVAFRLSQSAEAETFQVTVPVTTAASQSDAELYAMAVLSNPTATKTSNEGEYSVFIDENFSGNLVVRVKSSSAADSDSWVRCDAYTGCGTYENGVSSVLPNDGDLNVDFGEWYKEDLELTSVKNITAPSANKTTLLGKNADPSRKLVSNLSFLTQVAAKILIDGAKAGTPVDEEQVGNASTKVILSLLGPDGLVSAASLIADITTGGAVDLANIDENAQIDGGIFALVQLATSLQSLASEEGSSNLNELIGNLASGVSENKFNLTEGQSGYDPVLAGLKGRVEQAAQKVAAVLVAIATNDSAAISDLNLPQGVLDRIRKSLDDAIENGTIEQSELVDIANEVKERLERIGCQDDTSTDVDECSAGSDNTSLFERLVTKLTNDSEAAVASLAILDALIVSIETQITAASALEAEAVDADTAVNFYLAVLKAYELAFNANDRNIAGRLATRLERFTEKTLDSAILANNKLNSTASAALVESVTELFSSVVSSAAKVTGDEGLHVDLVALLAAAEAKLEEFDANNLAAQREAQLAVDTATTDNTNLTEAKSAAVTSFDQAVALRDPQSVENATRYLELAKVALDNAVIFIEKAKTARRSANIALDKAEAFQNVAATEAEIAAASELVASANQFVTNANTELATANTHFPEALAELAKAETAYAIIKELPDVKATTQTLADIKLVSDQGLDVIETVGELLVDITGEALDNGTTEGDKASTLHQGWSYNYNATNLTLEIKHAEQGSIAAAMELVSKDGNTGAVYAWGGELTPTDSVTVAFDSGDLAACAEAYENNADSDSIMGSCFVVEYKGEVNTDNLGSAEDINSKSITHLQLTDGELDFSGRFEHSLEELTPQSTSTQSDDGTVEEETEKGHLEISGSSGDLAFVMYVDTMDSDTESTTKVKLKVEEDGYVLMGESSGDEELSGYIKANDYKYAEWAEIAQGMQVTYIDGEVKEYVGLTFRPTSDTSN